MSYKSEENQNVAPSSLLQWQRVRRVHSDLYAVTAWIYSRWNYGATNVAPAYRLLLLRRRGPIKKHIHVKERIKTLVMDLENKASNDCAGEGQKQFNQPNIYVTNVNVVFYVNCNEDSLRWTRGVSTGT
jgi:hypothetical protein